MSPKPIRHAVSVVIQNPQGQTLFALRSKYKSDNQLVWSLPSCFVAAGESYADAVRRVGVEKLGVKLEPGELLAEGKADRGDWILFMHDFAATIVTGKPMVDPKEYVELKWEDPVKQIDSMEKMGDCCRLYKQYLTES